MFNNQQKLFRAFDHFEYKWKYPGNATITKHSTIKLP